MTAAQQAKAAAKKKGGNNVLIVGSILGGVALIVLGVVGYMLIAGGDTVRGEAGRGPRRQHRRRSDCRRRSARTRPRTPPVAAIRPGARRRRRPLTAGAAAPTTPARSALDPGLQTPVAEISNLLPNDTQSVLSINMDRLRSCTLGQQAFESPIGFRPETFKQGFGIGVEEMPRFIRAKTSARTGRST